MAALKAAHVSVVPHLDEVPAATPAVKPGRRFQVIGHRGNGMNALSSPSPDPRLAAVKENSILSFNHAGRFPIDFVEFDVQVTRDGHPIIFHDIFILTEEAGDLSEKRVTDLSLQEFLSYGPQKEPGNTGKPLIRRSCKDNRAFLWTVEADDHLCTLQEAFESVYTHLGFNIELKFDDDADYQEEKLIHALQVILGVVLDHASDRLIIFSTFHPDAARLMRRLQSMYPVFFLTDAGTELYADGRRNSLEAAIRLCLESGLQGIVSEVRGVLRDPSAIARIKHANLGLLTYGELNNVAEAVCMQHMMGVDGVIVDLVQEITDAVSDLSHLGGERVGEGSGEAAAMPRFFQRELAFNLAQAYTRAGEAALGLLVGQQWQLLDSS